MKFTGEGMDICVCKNILKEKKKMDQRQFFARFHFFYKSISAKEYNNEKYVEQN